MLRERRGGLEETVDPCGFFISEEHPGSSTPSLYYNSPEVQLKI
jgi:hypothetical protein